MSAPVIHDLDGVAHPVTVPELLRMREDAELSIVAVRGRLGHAPVYGAGWAHPERRAEDEDRLEVLRKTIEQIERDLAILRGAK